MDVEVEHLTLDAIGRELVISSGADPAMAARAISLREVAKDLPKPWLIGAHAAVSAEVDAAVRDHFIEMRNWPASAIKREISGSNDFERVAILYAYTMVARDEHTHWNKYWPAIESAYGDGFAEAQTLRPFLTSCWEGIYNRSDERLLRPPRGGGNNRRHIRWPLMHAGLARGEVHRFARFVSWVAALEDIPVSDVGAALLDRPPEQFTQIVCDWAESLAPHTPPARAQIIVDNPDDSAAAFMLQLGIATSMPRLVEALDELSARGEGAGSVERGPVRLQMPTFVLDTDRGLAGKICLQIAGSIPLRGYLNASVGTTDFSLARMHRQGGRRVFSDRAAIGHKAEWWTWPDRIELEYRSEDTGEERRQSRRIPPSPFRIDPASGDKVGAMLFDLETLRLTHRLVPGARIAVIARADVLSHPSLERALDFGAPPEVFDDHGFLRLDAVVADPPDSAEECDDLLEDLAHLVGSNLTWTSAPACRIEIRGPRDRQSRARRVPVLEYGRRPIHIVATNVQTEADLHVVVQSRGADATGSSALIAPIVAALQPGSNTTIEVPPGATTPAAVRVLVGGEELARFDLVEAENPPLVPLPDARLALDDVSRDRPSIFEDDDDLRATRRVIGRAYAGAWIETFIDSGPVLRSIQVSSSDGDFALNLPETGTRVAAFDGIRWLPELNLDSRVSCSKISASRIDGGVRLSWSIPDLVESCTLLVGTTTDMPGIAQIEAHGEDGVWRADVTASSLASLGKAAFFAIIGDGDVLRVQKSSAKIEMPPIRNTGSLKLAQAASANWLQYSDRIDSWLDVYRDAVPGVRTGLMQRARLAGIKPVLDGIGFAAMNLIAGAPDLVLDVLLDRLPPVEFDRFNAWRELEVTLTPAGFRGVTDFERDGAPEAPLEIIARAAPSPVRLSWGQFITHGRVEPGGPNGALGVSGFDGVRCRSCNGVFAAAFQLDLLPNHGCDRIDHDPIAEFTVERATANAHAVLAAVLHSLKSAIGGQQAPNGLHQRIMEGMVSAAPHLRNQRTPLLHVVDAAIELHRLLVDVLYGTGGDLRLHAFTTRRRSLLEPNATYAAIAIALASIGTFPASEWEEAT